MFIKVTDPDLQTIWVRQDLIVAVVIPSPLSKSTQCQIIAQGVVIPVSQIEASNVAQTIVRSEASQVTHLAKGDVL